MLYPKKSLSRPMSKSLFPVFTSRNFMILHLIFKSLIHQVFFFNDVRCVQFSCKLNYTIPIFKFHPSNSSHFGIKSKICNWAKKLLNYMSSLNVIRHIFFSLLFRLCLVGWLCIYFPYVIFFLYNAPLGQVFVKLITFFFLKGSSLTL